MPDARPNGSWFRSNLFPPHMRLVHYEISLISMEPVEVARRSGSIKGIPADSNALRVRTMAATIHGGIVGPSEERARISKKCRAWCLENVIPTGDDYEKRCVALLFADLDVFEKPEFTSWLPAGDDYYEQEHL